MTEQSGCVAKDLAESLNEMHIHEPPNLVAQDESGPTSILCELSEMKHADFDIEPSDESDDSGSEKILLFMDKFNQSIAKLGLNENVTDKIYKLIETLLSETSTCPTEYIHSNPEESPIEVINVGTNFILEKKNYPINTSYKRKKFYEAGDLFVKPQELAIGTIGTRIEMKRENKTKRAITVRVQNSKLPPSLAYNQSNIHMLLLCNSNDLKTQQTDHNNLWELSKK